VRRIARRSRHSGGCSTNCPVSGRSLESSVDNSGHSVGRAAISAIAFKPGYGGGRWFESTAAHHVTNPVTSVASPCRLATPRLGRRPVAEFRPFNSGRWEPIIIASSFDGRSPITIDVSLTWRRSSVPSITATGAELYYEVRGNGPPVLLIPGGGLDGGTFGALAEILAGEFTVVGYDRRGLSRSPRPEGWSETSIAEQADDAAGLLRELGRKGVEPSKTCRPRKLAVGPSHGQGLRPTASCCPRGCSLRSHQRADPRRG
jgi:Alpha/beta hydrolase family